MSLTIQPKQPFSSDSLPIYQLVEDNNYEAAEYVLKNMDPKSLSLLYEKLKDKEITFIDFLLGKNAEESKNLLHQIIQKTKDEFSQFQKKNPFESALKNGKMNTFKNLVNYKPSLLTERDFLLCLDRILVNNLNTSCEILLNNIEEKNFQLIAKGGTSSPLAKSIHLKSLLVFEVFLKNLYKIAGTKRNILSTLKRKHLDLLDFVIQQPSELCFLNAIWNQDRPKLTDKNEPITKYSTGVNKSFRQLFQTSD